MEHLTMHHLREAELVSWAEQVRQAQERLDVLPPASDPATGSVRRPGLGMRMRQLFGGRPAGRHA